MGRPASRVSIASAGRLAVDISDDVWQHIEGAYGRSLPTELRQEICNAMKAFLDWALFEQAAPLVSQVEKEIKAIKRPARSLRKALLQLRKQTWVDRSADRRARSMICERAGLPLQRGHDALQHYVLQIIKGCDLGIQQIIKGSDLALADLPKERRAGFRKGEAWNSWVRRLAAAMEKRGFPATVRKDDYEDKDKPPSPFVVFISRLQKCKCIRTPELQECQSIPPEFQRSPRSNKALVQAIYNALKRPRGVERPKDDLEVFARTDDVEQEIFESAFYEGRRRASHKPRNTRKARRS